MLGALGRLGVWLAASAAGPEIDGAAREAHARHLRWEDMRPEVALEEVEAWFRAAPRGASRPLDAVLAGALARRLVAMKSLGHPDAERVFQEAVAEPVRGLGPEDAERLAWESEVARALARVDENDAALAIGRPALEVLSRMAVAPDAGLEVLEPLRIALGAVATPLERTGRPGEALALRVEAVAVTRRAHGDHHALTADSLLRLAATADGSSALDVARASALEALAIRRALPEAESDPEIPRVLFRLARIAIVLKDPAGALEALDEALVRARGAVPPDPKWVQVLLNARTVAYDKAGDRERARAAYEELIPLARATENANVVTAALYNLAVLAKTDGDLDRAAALLREAYALHASAGDGDSAEAGHALGQLGATLSRRHDRAEALDVLQRSIAIRERTVGPENPRLVTAHINLARVEEAGLGDLAAAHARRTRAMAISAPLLDLLDTLPERDALSLLEDALKARNEWLRTEEDHARAWSQVLATKGLVAARLRHAHTLALSRPETADLARELQGVRGELARLALAPSADRATALRDLQARREDLEARIRRATGAGGSSELGSGGVPTPAELCAALPPGGAVVDAVRHNMSGDALDAFVMRADDCVVRRLELGASQVAEEAVVAWRSVLSDPHGLQSRADQRGSRVTELLWTPLAPHLVGVDHLFFVPDGELAGAPLAALPLDDGRYLLETMQVTYLDRANDLVRAPGSTGGGALIVGGVDFGAAPPEPPSTGRGCAIGPFDPLPGTATEADLVASRWHGPVRALTGAEAEVRSVVEALPGKEVIHLATHGFVLPSRCEAEIGAPGGVDPLARSGLALAGANTAGAGDDGLLTAAEVAGLDLGAARLVVLSACGTGLGDALAGEGVLGLRRGFTIAGARTIVMSLWNVPDADTADLMAAFYGAMEGRRGRSPAEALRAAQRSVLARQRALGQVDATAWAAFVLAGDWR